jgi:hypothetical protein
MTTATNYIELDGKRYLTPGKKWQPTLHKPTTVRQTLLGATDVTFGVGSTREWNGIIEAPASVADPATWGTITTLRAAIRKKTSLPFKDHYGASYTVAFFGNLVEESLSPVWDDPNNIIQITARLVA